MKEKYFSPAPFWFWNGKLNKAEIERQIDEMHAQSVHSFVIHARTGLETTYFSEAWFDCVSAALARAKMLGMQVWLYDEENFPSGYGGGKVLERNPALFGKHLKIACTDKKEHGKNVISSVEAQNGGYYTFTCHRTLWKPAYTESLYIDVLNKQTALLFTEIIHKEYYKRFKQYFGSVIKGFFTDEPGFYNNIHFDPNTRDDDTVVWTDDFAEAFIADNGYDIRQFLPHVFRNINGRSAQYRYDFFEEAGKLYRERFLLPIKKACNDMGVKLIGHLHMEDYMHFQIGTQGNFMKAVACLDFAGLDKIDANNEKITEKVVSSVAHNCGKNFVMSESFALSGWKLDFSEMRRIADYQFVRGVNFLVPHAFYYSIDGFRKFESPPSQFVQNPYWKYYGRFADYISRTCNLLQEGEPLSEVAVYYPHEQAVARYTPDDFSACINFDKKIQAVAMGLLDKQIDFDFVDRETLLSGLVGKKMLIVPYLDKADDKVAAALGKIEIPVLMLDCKLVEFKQKKNFLYIDEPWLLKSYTYAFNADNLAVFVRERLLTDVRLKFTDEGIKYIKRKGVRTLYYFVNEQPYYKENVIIFNENSCPLKYNAYSDAFTATDSSVKNGMCEVAVNFAPYESCFFIFGNEEIACERLYPSSYKTVLKVRAERMTVDGKETKDVGFWNEKGFDKFSGSGQYVFGFAAEKGKYHVVFSLGRVYSTAEFTLNGKHIGTEIFAPHELACDCELLEHNTLTVTVCNTLSNRFEDDSALSGIEGFLKVTITDASEKEN